MQVDVWMCVTLDNIWTIRGDVCSVRLGLYLRVKVHNALNVDQVHNQIKYNQNAFNVVLDKYQMKKMDMYVKYAQMERFTVKLINHVSANAIKMNNLIILMAIRFVLNVNPSTCQMMV